MVWNVLEELDFIDQRALRALHVNTLIESTYELAPNYWEGAGDIAIGDSDRRYRRLAGPVDNDMYLVNRGSLPEWRMLDDTLLLTSDFQTTYVGSTFVSGYVLIKRSHIQRSASYDRTTEIDWEIEEDGISVVNGFSPLVSVGALPINNSVMHLNHNLESNIIELRCARNSHFTIIGLYNHISGLGSLSEFFPSNNSIGFNNSLDAQIRSFDVLGRGLTNEVAFDLVDVSLFGNDIALGDYASYLYVYLFYRY